MTDAPRDVPALLPCPFCGGKGRLCTGNAFHWVRCDECRTEGPALVGPLNAAANWNRRAASETKGGRGWPS